MKLTVGPSDERNSTNVETNNTLPAPLQ